MIVPYVYKQTLLKLDNVCLEYDGRPILRNVCGEIKDVYIPGRVTGQIVALLGPSGRGKCLATDTPVIMFDGSIKGVQDIKVGDLLMGPDSQSRKVLSLAHGWDEMYDVVPVKGDTYRVNRGHIISLALCRSKRSKARIDNIPVESYNWRSRSFRNRAKGYRVGVDFPSKDVPLDPYFLGLWLGDGDSDSASITNVDEEIIEALRDFASKIGAKMTTYDYENRCTRFHIHTDYIRRGSPRRALRSLGVLSNKHIPLLYRANSRDVRLEVLAGIVDTDGSYHDNCVDFVSKCKQLAIDVCYLARSLGMAAYMKPCNKTSQNGTRGSYYRVCISGETSQIPTKVARKKFYPRKQTKNVLHTGIQVSPAGRGEYFGFELSGDGMFLLGDFTVTHNTQTFRIMAGLQKPTSGQVLLADEKGFHPVVQGEVGVVAQNYPVFAHRTVMGNLMLAALAHESDAKKAEATVVEGLENFKLADKAKLYPCQLSGGQRQRVAILQMLMCREPFILMDEPFASLDLINIEIACETIAHAANLNELNTFLIVTHDVTAAVSIADHIWLLGNERDDKGNPIPGARIVQTYDLLERGLCYEPGSITNPLFMDTVREIKEKFRTL